VPYPGQAGASGPGAPQYPAWAQNTASAQAGQPGAPQYPAWAQTSGAAYVPPPARQPAGPKSNTKTFIFAGLAVVMLALSALCVIIAGSFANVMSGGTIGSWTLTSSLSGDSETFTLDARTSYIIQGRLNVDGTYAPFCTVRAPNGNPVSLAEQDGTASIGGYADIESFKTTDAGPYTITCTRATTFPYISDMRLVRKGGNILMSFLLCVAAVIVFAALAVQHNSQYKKAQVLSARLGAQPAQPAQPAGAQEPWRAPAAAAPAWSAPAAAPPAATPPGFQAAAATPPAAAAAATPQGFQPQGFQPSAGQDQPQWQYATPAQPQAPYQPPAPSQASPVAPPPPAAEPAAGPSSSPLSESTPPTDAATPPAPAGDGVNRSQPGQ
jgi:hypothetical protein